MAPIDDSDAPDPEDALATLETLEVKGRAPETGYSRDQFGPTWEDVDDNGCSTRNDVLARDLTQVEKGPDDCSVESGTLEDPYTDTIIDFTAGQETSDEVHIDHVVALGDAWQKGAQQISAEDRLAFANDPLNLLAVDGPANEAKGDGDAATWLPPNRDYWCPYISRQVEVKAKYDLWVTQPERDRIKEIIEDCDEQPTPETTAPEPSPEPTSEPADEEDAPAATEDRDGDGIVGEGTGRERSTAPAPATTPDPVPAPAPAPERAPVVPQPEPAAPAVSFPNCTAAKQAGAAPLYRGSPGYAPKLDSDDDGVACES